MNKFGMPQATFQRHFSTSAARCFGRLVTWRLSMGSHLALLRPVLRRVAPRLKHLARGGPRARRVSYTTCVKKHPKRDTDDSHAPHHTSFAVIRRMEMHPRHLLARGTQLHWIWPRRVFCRRRQETCFAFAFRIVDWLCCMMILNYVVSSFIYHHCGAYDRYRQYCSKMPQFLWNLAVLFEMNPDEISLQNPKRISYANCISQSLHSSWWRSKELMRIARSRSSSWLLAR